MAAALSLLVACSGTRTLLPETPPDTGPSVDTSEPPMDPTGRRADPPSCQAPAAPSPDLWYTRAVFYEVFVRSFQDSDGDGIGDLQGLISRLDYLNDGDPNTTSDMGVTALWLMPINASPSYHGYDVTNYRVIDPAYGTLDDFDQLIKAAEKRGIHIVMDLVVNHTSRLHPWFVAGKRGPEESTHDWYVWADEKLSWGKPWSGAGSTWHAVADRFYYGVFWEGMPDLNFKNPAVRTELLDIATFWLKRGVAGFRLDAARYLVENGEGTGQSDQPETHAFWREFRAHVAKERPDALLLGEVWTDFDVTTTYFGQGDELQMVFGFDRATGIRDGLRLGSAGSLSSRLCAELAGLPQHGLMGSFLTNHDLDRFATVVPDPDALAQSAALLLTLPGVPFIYYGEELGLANGPASGDLAKRLPMRWDDSDHFGFTAGEGAWQPDEGNSTVADAKAQSASAQSLLSQYRRLVHLRRAHPALLVGSTARLPVTHSGGSVVAWVREAGTSRALVVANLSKADAIDVTLDLTGQTLPAAAVSAVLGATQPVPAPIEPGKPYHLGPLPARATTVLILESRSPSATEPRRTPDAEVSLKEQSKKTVGSP